LASERRVFRQQAVGAQILAQPVLSRRGIRNYAGVAGQIRMGLQVSSGQEPGQLHNRGRRDRQSQTQPFQEIQPQMSLAIFDGAETGCAAAGPGGDFLLGQTHLFAQTEQDQPDGNFQQTGRLPFVRAFRIRYFG
jgi:hypothetical protein